jgi:phospholipid/cholesterol/gamma-HCH transport system ATP-binding protein
MTILSLNNVSTKLGGRIINRNVSLEVQEQETLALIGPSGSGKSTLLKAMVGLLPITTGTIDVLGYNIHNLTHQEAYFLYRNWGFLFQEGALFGNFTVLQNIYVPLEHLFGIPFDIGSELAYTKLKMVGLSERVASLYPSELSGGMKKRVGLARALATDPKLLFLDEPTAGLDPLAAGEFDDLIFALKESLNLTVIMVTHDLSTLKSKTDRIAVITEHGIVVGTLQKLLKSQDPEIHEYFHSPRAEEIFY